MIPTRRPRRLLRRLALASGGTAILAVSVHLIAVALFRPSLDRPWSPDQAVLPTAQVVGGIVTIRNVRHAVYRSVDDYDPSWEDRTYRLDDLESIWFAVEPFPGFPGAAHTLLSFGFADDRYLAVSVEIRKELGESFSAWRGMLRQYELMYVVADEQDVLGLRAVHRGNPVLLLPVRTSPDRVRSTFLSVLQRVNALAERPEFYHTVVNNCTTNIVRHANEAVPGRIPFGRAMIFPALSARRAHQLGLVATALEFSEASRHFLINDLARRYADDPAFSARIRGVPPPASGGMAGRADP